MRDIYLYESKHKESYVVQEHHHDNFQILYAIEGEGTIRLKGKEYALKQDGVAVLYPFSDHEVASDASFTLLVLEFDEFLLKDHVASYWKQNVITESMVMQLELTHANEMRLLLRRLLFEQNQLQSLSSWSMQIYWLEVLHLLAQAHQAKPILDANDLRAERIRQFIDNHYFETLTTHQIAQRLGVSSRHASSIFKERYQMTPMQYLTEVRISVAKKLLLESDKDIISVSFEVGYESLATFYRIFKKHVLVSPSKFRQQGES